MRHRAPEVTIAMPQQRPNSGMASRIFLGLQDTDHLAALRFRGLLYRALWIEDKDISESKVLSQILEQSGIE